MLEQAQLEKLSHQKLQVTQKPLLIVGIRMGITMNKSILAIALTAGISLVGCASNSELAQVRAMAEKAQASADQALQAANAATQAANAVKGTSDQAMATAAQADKKADNALNTANQVNEKIDRMFKKTMMK
ncbi:MAG: hypothetical protein KUG71_08460 [Porticoccaceae bacterium]|nr:hypothetical protein [Porticoccaceae bacterium]